MSKKYTLEEGQIFAVELSNDSFTIAQLVNHCKIDSKDSIDTFAFFNYNYSSLEGINKNLDELKLSNPFSIVTVNGYPRNYGWDLLGSKCINCSLNYKEDISSSGFYKNRSTDPQSFLEPYFGLYPWDAYPKGHIDKHILPNADMGKRIKHCKDYQIKELIEVLGENHIKVQERLK